MRTQRITNPAIEPITLAEAKAQARVDASFTADDDYLNALITAARQWAEMYTGRSFNTQTWEMRLDNWRHPIRLQFAPLISVTSIQYVDSSGTTLTLPTTEYQVVPTNIPPLIVPSYTAVWPTLRDQPDSVIVRYVTGYGPTMADVPQRIRLAVKMMVAYWYENREPAIVGGTIAQVPMTVEALLAIDRVFSFGEGQ
jgi:uncharacterized phiE125 gp8 family phage protein